MISPPLKPSSPQDIKSINCNSTYALLTLDHIRRYHIRVNIVSSTGKIMAPATYFATMAGAADLDYTLEVLRLFQTHKHGNGLTAKTRDGIYWRARGYR